jgi:RHS repeat-associated protein
LQTCFEGPFGEVIRATGPVAKVNPFRFSTKYQDDESDLFYYGYRYYNPGLGRWISRDPIEEKGGMNLYAVAANEAVDDVDAFGLCVSCRCISVQTSPPGPKLKKLGFYRNKMNGISFGQPITITFTVSGDPNHCSYYFNEPSNGARFVLPNNRAVSSEGTYGLDVQLPTNVYEDDMGYVVGELGTYQIKADITQTYRCVNSDGTETMPPVTKHFSGHAKKKWKPK